jgi:hypothetical protein
MPPSCVQYCTWNWFKKQSPHSTYIIGPNLHELLESAQLPFEEERLSRMSRVEPAHTWPTVSWKLPLPALTPHWLEVQGPNKHPPFNYIQPMFLHDNSWIKCHHQYCSPPSRLAPKITEVIKTSTDLVPKWYTSKSNHGTMTNHSHGNRGRTKVYHVIYTKAQSTQAKITRDSHSQLVEDLQLSSWRHSFGTLLICRRPSEQPMLHESFVYSPRPSVPPHPPDVLKFSFSLLWKGNFRMIAVNVMLWFFNQGRSKLGVNEKVLGCGQGARMQVGSHTHDFLPTL